MREHVDNQVPKKHLNHIPLFSVYINTSTLCIWLSGYSKRGGIFFFSHFKVSEISISGYFKCHSVFPKSFSQKQLFHPNKGISHNSEKDSNLELKKK